MTPMPQAKLEIFKAGVKPVTSHNLKKSIPELAKSSLQDLAAGSKLMTPTRVTLQVHHPIRFPAHRQHARPNPSRPVTIHNPKPQLLATGKLQAPQGLLICLVDHSIANALDRGAFHPFHNPFK